MSDVLKAAVRLCCFKCSRLILSSILFDIHINRVVFLVINLFNVTLLLSLTNLSVSPYVVLTDYSVVINTIIYNVRYSESVLQCTPLLKEFNMILLDGSTPLYIFLI